MKKINECYLCGEKKECITREDKILCLDCNKEVLLIRDSFYFYFSDDKKSIKIFEEDYNMQCTIPLEILKKLINNYEI